MESMVKGKTTLEIGGIKDSFPCEMGIKSPVQRQGSEEAKTTSSTDSFLRSLPRRERRKQNSPYKHKCGGVKVDFSRWSRSVHVNEMQSTHSRKM